MTVAHEDPDPPAFAGWVCGYGSLAELTGPVAFADGPRSPRWALLREHRRSWGVAVDNRSAATDYRHYVDAAGERVAAFVAYLDVAPEPGASCGVFCLPVDADRLRAVDAREVNYARAALDPALLEPVDRDGPPGEAPWSPGDPVWTYHGLDDARARARGAAADGTLVVASTYREIVDEGFAAQPASLPAFDASTTPASGPVVALWRRGHGSHPPPPGAAAAQPSP